MESNAQKVTFLRHPGPEHGVCKKDQILIRIFLGKVGMDLDKSILMNEWQ